MNYPILITNLQKLSQGSGFLMKVLYGLGCGHGCGRCHGPGGPGPAAPATGRPQAGSLTRSLRICQSREPDWPDSLAREPPSLRHDQSMVTVAAQVRVGVGLGCDGDNPGLTATILGRPGLSPESTRMAHDSLFKTAQTT